MIKAVLDTHDTRKVWISCFPQWTNRLSGKRRRWFRAGAFGRQTLQILLTGWHRQPDKHNQDNFPKSAAHTTKYQLNIQVLYDFLTSAVAYFIVFLLHTFTLWLRLSVWAAGDAMATRMLMNSASIQQCGACVSVMHVTCETVMSVSSCNHLLEMAHRVQHYREFLGNVYVFQSQPAAIVCLKGRRQRSSNGLWSEKRHNYWIFNTETVKQTDSVSLSIWAVYVAG